MDTFNSDDLKTLIEAQAGNCVSIYMPTHRTAADIQKDRIRFKNLVRESAETLVHMGVRNADAQTFIGPLQELLDDRAFWEHRSDGLAVFISDRLFRCYRLPVDFEQLLVAAGRFHTKPLLPLLAGDTHFYVLAISQNQVRLLECSRYSAKELDLGPVPKSLAQTLRYDDPEKQLQFHTGTSTRTGTRPALFHGHGVGVDDRKSDLLRYFRGIDKGLRKLLQGKEAPLVLAGVDYLFPIYREASSYGNLCEDGIAGNPESMSVDALHREAWPIVEPYFRQAELDAVGRYNGLHGQDRVTNDLEEAIRAAYHGRVELLFVAVGVQQWGVFDPKSNVIEIRENPEPDDIDLLDFAAVQALTKGGTVFAMPPEKVPDRALLAALMRY
jgi:hypothetical protein